VPLAETLKGCKAIVEGESDNWDESSLYMVGAIADAREKEAYPNRETKPA
jgi:F-type H+-transporting ATPase subunit beta